MNDAIVREYAKEAHRIAKSNPTFARFPEWVLQEIVQYWMTDGEESSGKKSMPRSAIISTRSR